MLNTCDFFATLVTMVQFGGQQLRAVLDSFIYDGLENIISGAVIKKDCLHHFFLKGGG